MSFPLPPQKSLNCLWCKTKVAKDAVKAQSVSFLIVAENHHGKHTSNGIWFSTLSPTRLSLKSGKADHYESWYQRHYHCLQRSLNRIKNNHSRFTTPYGSTSKRREGKKKRLEIVIQLSDTATTRSQDLLSWEGKVQSLQDLTSLLLQQRRCLVELKTTWHYDKWNWWTDLPPHNRGERGWHNTPLFHLGDRTHSTPAPLGDGDHLEALPWPSRPGPHKIQVIVQPFVSKKRKRRKWIEAKHRWLSLKRTAPTAYHYNFFLF